MNTRKTATVTVTDIVSFARENLWIGCDRYGDAIIEKFYCVVMQADNGEILKCFTKFNREFASQVRIGNSFTLSYVEKEWRLHSEGSYTAVVYCKIGRTKAEILAEKKAEKKAKRLAKLGL
jgi:hypothetical protein